MRRGLLRGLLNSEADVEVLGCASRMEKAGMRQACPEFSTAKPMRATSAGEVISELCGRGRLLLWRR